MSVVPATPSPDWASRLRVTQGRVILSEWTKFRSLRSTRWSLLVTVVLAIGIPLLAATITDARWSHMSVQEQLARQPLDIALVGVRIAQLAIGVLGVLVISSEYSTGMIRASLGAVPKRLPVLWAKIVRARHGLVRACGSGGAGGVLRDAEDPRAAPDPQGLVH